MDTREQIKQYIETCEVFPTVRQICRAVGLRSTNTVVYHLDKLGIRPKGNYPRSMYSAKVLRQKIIEILGSKCVQCGYSDIRALQIDHVNSNGAYERKSIGIPKMYAKAYEEVSRGNYENYQILCANCNWIKRHTHDEL